MFSLLKSLSKAMIPGGGLLPPADVRLTVLPLRESNCQTFEDGEDTDPDDEPVDNKAQLMVVQGWPAGLRLIKAQSFLCHCGHLKNPNTRWTHIHSSSALTGFYTNPGVRQSRSARFGVKRTEDEALKIVLGWMFAQHEEALKRALNLSKGFIQSYYIDTIFCLLIL